MVGGLYLVGKRDAKYSNSFHPTAHGSFFSNSFQTCGSDCDEAPIQALKVRLQLLLRFLLEFSHARAWIARPATVSTASSHPHPTSSSLKPFAHLGIVDWGGKPIHLPQNVRPAAPASFSNCSLCCSYSCMSQPITAATLCIRYCLQCL